MGNSFVKYMYITIISLEAFLTCMQLGVLTAQVIPIFGMVTQYMYVYLLHVVGKFPLAS